MSGRVSGRSLVRLSLSDLRLRGRLFGEILRVGAPSLLSNVKANLTVVLLTGFVGPFGTTALAGYGMGARLEYLQIPLVFGFGSALVTMVGTNIGAGQRARAERIAWTGAGMAAALTGAIGLGAALVPRAWLGLFSTDSQVLQRGAMYLRIVVPVYGFFGLGLALYLASQGAGRLLWPHPGWVQPARHRERGRLDGDPLVRRRTDGALRRDGHRLRGVRGHCDGGP